jgi:ribosome-binding factor A
MAAGRMRRVDEAVRAVLSDAITTDLKDPRIGFVTVTAVDTSPDLRQAKVFVSVLGSDADVESSLAGLQSAHGFLQRRVARELSLKHTPTLDFVFDDTTRRADRINRLL